MSSRILHAGVLLLVIALACGCSGPTAPSAPKTVPQTEPQSQPVPPTGGMTKIDGQYSLTITMSPGCSLPAEVRQRTYTATVREPRAGYVTVELSGADFAIVQPPYYKAGFEGARNGDTIHFVVDNGYGAEYSLTESIDGRLLNFEGVADTSVADSGIEGYFAAEIRYFVPVGPPEMLGSCTAQDHRMVFTPQAQP